MDMPERVGDLEALDMVVSCCEELNTRRVWKESGRVGGSGAAAALGE